MQKHPFTVALNLNSDLSGYVHKEVLQGEADWEINFARANVILFKQVMAGIYQQVHSIPSNSDNLAGTALPVGTKAVITPVMEDYQLSTPKQSKTKYFEVWIKYRMQLYDTSGKLIEDWPFTAYGRNRKDLLGASDALNEATRRAMRDAATAVVLDFMKQPKVNRFFYDSTAAKAKN